MLNRVFGLQETLSLITCLWMNKSMISLKSVRWACQLVSFPPVCCGWSPLSLFQSLVKVGVIYGKSVGKRKIQKNRMRRTDSKSYRCSLPTAYFREIRSLRTSVSQLSYERMKSLGNISLLKLSHSRAMLMALIQIIKATQKLPAGTMQWTESNLMLKTWKKKWEWGK